MGPKRIFVGSSNEARRILGELQLAVSRSAFREEVELVPWYAEDVFRISDLTLSRLMEIPIHFQGALFVLTGNDGKWWSRPDGSDPHFNVFLEIGIAMGSLGVQNVVIVKTAGLNLPSDLAGLTVVEIQESIRSTDADLAAHKLGKHFSSVRPSRAVGEGSLLGLEPVNFSLTEDVNRFYREFQTYLRNSRRFVLLSGSGFQITEEDPESRRRARQYLRVLVGCANRHTIVRVENASKDSMQEWLRMVAKYFAHLKNARIYIPTSRRRHIIKDICLIDPEDDEAVVEMSLPTSSLEGIDYAERVTVGVFLRSQRAAGTLQRTFAQHLQDKREYRRVDGRGGLAMLAHYGLEADGSYDQVPGVGGPNLYFAYGSNMFSEQIRDRTPSAKPVGTAILRGYRLVFGVPGTVFPNAVATVLKTEEAPRIGSGVPGGLFELSNVDIDRMDFYEGVEEGEYVRRTVEVELDNGRAVHAEIYLHNPERRLDERPPSLGYLERMIIGSRDLGLPDWWTAHLESLRSGAVE